MMNDASEVRSEGIRQKLPLALVGWSSLLGCYIVACGEENKTRRRARKAAHVPDGHQDQSLWAVLGCDQHSAGVEGASPAACTNFGEIRSAAPDFAAMTHALASAFVCSWVKPLNHCLASHGECTLKQMTPDDETVVSHFLPIGS